MVKDFYDTRPDSAGSRINYIRVAGQQIYFTVTIPAQYGQFRSYLWMTDGTTNGTGMVSSEVYNIRNITPIYPGSPNSSVIYFAGDQSLRFGQPNALYRADGTGGAEPMTP